jgi:hypothetical protein
MDIMVKPPLGTCPGTLLRFGRFYAVTPSNVFYYRPTAVVRRSLVSQSSNGSSCTKAYPIRSHDAV